MVHAADRRWPVAVIQGGGVISSTASANNDRRVNCAGAKIRVNRTNYHLSLHLDRLPCDGTGRWTTLDDFFDAGSTERTSCSRWTKRRIVGRWFTESESSAKPCETARPSTIGSPFRIGLARPISHRCWNWSPKSKEVTNGPARDSHDGQPTGLRDPDPSSSTNRTRNRRTRITRPASRRLGACRRGIARVRSGRNGNH